MAPLHWVLVACMLLSAQTLLAARHVKRPPRPPLLTSSAPKPPPSPPSPPTPPPPPPVEDFMIMRPASAATDVAGSFNADGSDSLHRLLTWNVDPKVDEPDWRPFGSFGSTNSNESEVLAAHPVSWARPSNARVAKSPLGYDWVWDSRGYGISHPYRAGSLWRPRCPVGYTSLGDVMVWDWENPELSGAKLDRVWCVVSCCTELCRDQGAWVWDTTFKYLVWDDEELAFSNDMQLYGVGTYSNGLGTFRGQPEAWPAPRDSSLQLCLKPQCKKTIGLKKISVLELTPEDVLIDGDAKEVTVDVYDYAAVKNDGSVPITVHNTFKRTFADTVRNEYSQRLSLANEYGLEVIGGIGFFGVISGGVNSSYKGTAGFEAGFLKVAGEDNTWKYEKTVDTEVAPQSTSQSSIVWKQASNVKIPYTALSEVQAVHYVSGEYVYNEGDVRALMKSSGFAGDFGKWYINADGHPTLQLITHGQLTANFASDVAVVNKCTPRDGYPDACK